MSTNKTSTYSLKKKLQTQATPNSIMGGCCSGTLDLVFQGLGDHQVDIGEGGRSPLSVRLSHKAKKLQIVGLATSAINTTTKPWQIYVTEGTPEPKPKSKATRKTATKKTATKKTAPAKKAAKKKK